MKILYVITQSELGGAQKNVLDLAVGLKDNYEVLVATGGDGRFFEELRKNQIPCVRLRYLRRAINPYFDLLGLLEIKKLIEKERPDILHLHSSKAGVLGSVAGYFYNRKRFANRSFSPLNGAQDDPSTGSGQAPSTHSTDTQGNPSTSLDVARDKSLGTFRMKVIYTVHGAVFTAAFSAMTQKMFLWLEKYTACFKDKIVCVSANDKKLWLEYRVAPENKLTVIHNGINTDKIDFLEKENAIDKLKIQGTRNEPKRQEIINENKIQDTRYKIQTGSNNKKTKIVGTIANFYPEKGLSYLIKAAKIINKNNLAPEAIFVVIGEGRERKRLEEMIRERHLENRFFLAGTLPEAARYLKAFDVFVLPSIKEGFPYVLLEAMAAGLPIVSSLVGGTPEIIKNGDDGFLILSKNPKILAERIADILDNPELAEKLSKNAREKVKEFSVEKMIEKTEKVYLE